MGENMCFISRKRLNKLQASIDDLKSVEINRLRDESAELKELKELLENVRLGVKKVQAFEDGSVKIIYNIPSVVIKKDADGNWEKNDFFYSVNKLELISFEDMLKISKVLDNIEL